MVFAAAMRAKVKTQYKNTQQENAEPDITAGELSPNFRRILSASFPVVWAAFVKRKLLAWILAAAVCCALITAAECFAFVWIVGGNGDPDIAILMNVVQFVSVLLALCSLRFAGFRLARDCG
jgi:hypothetical protein